MDNYLNHFLENKEEKLDVKDEPFDKLMFFYQSALKQLELQMNIIKEEFKIMYNYDLIDHIDTRIKEPKSIVKKMEKKKYKKTYYNLIEKINDIAGMRIVCTLKDDIFFIKDLVDYLSLLYVNGAVLFIVEIISTFKLKSSKSYSNAKVFRYYLYFMMAILLWMIFN